MRYLTSMSRTDAAQGSRIQDKIIMANPILAAWTCNWPPVIWQFSLAKSLLWAQEITCILWILHCHVRLLKKCHEYHESFECLIYCFLFQLDVMFSQLFAVSCQVRNPKLFLVPCFDTPWLKTDTDLHMFRCSLVALVLASWPLRCFSCHRWDSGIVWQCHHCDESQLFTIWKVQWDDV